MPQQQLQQQGTNTIVLVGGQPGYTAPIFDPVIAAKQQEL